MLLNGELKTVQFADQSLVVRPATDPKLEWFINTQEVAKGYGVKDAAIHSLKSRIKKELREGHHFTVLSETLDGRTGFTLKRTLWSKAGVIRLGFHLRSKRAREFRDFAESLILDHLENPKPLTLPRAPIKTPKQKLIESFTMADFKKLTPRERLKFLAQM
jgi:anti-repressor protein